MNITDGRGSNSKELKRKNFEVVRSWFKNNPKSTIKECCDGTGLSYPTVRARINESIKEN
jgi:hypothetical protein